MDVLTDKKLEQLKKQPTIETSIKKSACGEWVLLKTTILDIKPLSYFEKVMESF